MGAVIMNLETVFQDLDGVRVIPYDLNREKLVIFDFTRNNQELMNLDISDPRVFSRYISEKLEKNRSRVGIGRYDENRTIYDRSDIFDSPGNAHGQRRTLHIGLDLWVKEGTPVLAALDGVVHSFQDNTPLGDYGPTIILEHVQGEVRFYTLYGHLNRDCLKVLVKGQSIMSGQEIGLVGGIEENGQWPPHLHFEIIKDLKGQQGDFPGVCSKADREEYLRICPDPNLLLKIQALETP